MIKPPNTSYVGSQLVDDLDSDSESEPEQDEVGINNSVELERTSGITQTVNDIAAVRILANVFSTLPSPT